MTILQPINYRVGAGGMLLGFSYHDGDLLGIALSANRVLIRIANSDGGLVTISLVDASYLTVDSLWEGNCVNSIFLWDGGTIPSEELRKFASRREVTSTALREKLAKGQKIFSLQSSVGADIYCLCKEVEAAQASAEMENN